VRAELPGLKKDDIHVDVEDGCLTIRGERRSEIDEGDYTERSYGSFYRCIELPEGAEAKSAKARFHDGILEVKVDVPPVQKESRRVDVEVA